MKKKLNAEIITSMIFICILLVMVIVSFAYTPYDADAIDIVSRFEPPSFAHLLGTDNFGRDVLSRMMIGARYTLIVAVLTILISTIIGMISGVIAGYFGGMVDEVIMRLNDALASFPSILLALMLVTVLGQGQTTLMLALGIVFIPSFSRVARSGTLQFKERDFIKSSQVTGASPARIMFVHLLPNIFPSLLSAITIGFSNAILAEASMSFLGYGIQPPTPSWGRMLYEAETYLINAPWIALTPGLAIVITVLGFNFLGEGIHKNIT